MNAQIVLREITSPAVDLVGLCHASRDQLKACANCQPIAPGSGKLKADPVASGDALVLEQHRRSIDFADDSVHLAVVEEVANGETSGRALLHKRWTSLRAGIAESSVLLIHAQDLWLTIARA